MLHQDPLDFPALRVRSTTCSLAAPAASCPTGPARANSGYLCIQFDFKIDPDAQVASLSIGERQQLVLTPSAWAARYSSWTSRPPPSSAEQRAKPSSRAGEAGRAGQDGDLRLAQAGRSGRPVYTGVGDGAGKLTGEATMPCPTEWLVQMMFGQVITFKKREALPLGEPIRDAGSCDGQRLAPEVNDLSLELLAGQVIGLAGLEGSGQPVAPQAGPACCAPPPGISASAART